MTLVEVMVVVAVSTVLLGVVVSLIVGLQQWDRRFRNRNLHRDQQAQLAETMRTDIRRAKVVALNMPQVLEVIADDQSTIRYELTPEGCLRTVATSGKPPGSRELFSIGGYGSWSVEQSASGRRPLAVVAIKGRGEATDETDDLWGEIRAVIGADRPPVEVLQQTGTSTSDSPKPAP